MKTTKYTSQIPESLEIQSKYSEDEMKSLEDGTQELSRALKEALVKWIEGKSYKPSEDVCSILDSGVASFFINYMAGIHASRPNRARELLDEIKTIILDAIVEDMNNAVSR